MIENDTDKLIKVQLESLPKNLQRAISAVPWKTLTQQIGKDNGLNQEQLETFERETMFIIYAFEPVENYIPNLMRELNITEETAGMIAQTVGEKVLNYISEEAEKFERENQTVEPRVPEIAPGIHPMIELREKVHEVPHEQITNNNQAPIKQTVPVPDYRYPKGKDPYREPLE